MKSKIGQPRRLMRGIVSAGAAGLAGVAGLTVCGLVAGLVPSMALAAEAPETGQPTVQAAELGPASLSAQPSRWPLPHEGSDIATDPAVTWGVLPNGLTYAILPNSEPKDKISLRLLVGVGSLDETDPEQGLAHYLEHLAFNGSEHFPAGTLIERLQEWGIGFGSDANAHTSFEETVYKLDLPDPTPETLAVGLQVIADYAGRLLLLDEEVEKERGVILAEMRDRESPRMRTFRKLYGTLYAGTPVGDRFPIGLKETVEAITTAQMRAFYEKFYRPTNMVLAVTGTIDPAATAVMIAEEFADIPGEPLPEMVQLTTLPAVDAPAVVYHAEPEAAAGWVGMMAVTDSPTGIEQAAQAQDDVQLELMTLLLNRRMQAAIEANPDGPLLSASCYTYDYFTYRHIGWRGQPKPGQELAALQQMQTWWRQSLAFAPQAAEVTAAAAALRASLEKAVQQAANRPNKALAQALYSSVRDSTIFQTPAQKLALLSSALESPSADAMLAAWQVVAEPVRMVSVTDRVDLSAEADPEAAITATWQQGLAMPVEEPATVSEDAWAYGEVAASTAAPRQADLGQGITQISLENGIEILVLPRLAKPNEVLLNASVLIPSAQQRPNALTSLANTVAAASGLTDHDVPALQRLFSGSTVAFSGPSIGAERIAYQGQCTTDGIDEWFMRLRAAIEHQAIRPAVLQRQQERLLQSLRNNRDNLDAELGRRAEALMTPPDPVIRSPSLAHIERLTPGSIDRWLQPLLQGAPMTIAVVGDCSLSEVEAAAHRWLGSLPSRATVRVQDDLTAPGALLPEFPLVAGELHFSITGQEPRTIIRLGLPTDDFGDVRQVRRLAILAGSVREALRAELREALGQAYSPYAVHRPSDRYDGHGVLLVQASVEPSQVEKTREVIEGIIQRLGAEGVSEDVFSRVILPQRKSLGAYRETNGYWMQSVLAKGIEQPQRLEWALHMADDFEAITAEEVSELAKQYAHLDQAMWVFGSVEKPAASSDALDEQGDISDNAEE
jgi:zinc protease